MRPVYRWAHARASSPPTDTPRHIDFAAQPNVNAICAMKKHGKKNRSPFHDSGGRNRLEFLPKFALYFSALSPARKLLDQKCSAKNAPNGKDAGIKECQLDFFSLEEITCIGLDCRRRHALSPPSKLQPDRHENKELGKNVDI